jgi:multisubunit Na+/H+ antiporter MnhG subunit
LIGIVFIVLGIIFLISGTLTLIRLNKYFSEFYKENKKILIFATLGLSLPVLLRGSLNFIRGISESFESWIDNHQSTYNISFYFMCDLFPLLL